MFHLGFSLHHLLRTTVYRGVCLSWPCRWHLRYPRISGSPGHSTDGLTPEHLDPCTSEVSEESVGMGKAHSASLLITRWLHWSQLCAALACSVLKLLNYTTFKCLSLAPSRCGDITWDVLSETP